MFFIPPALEALIPGHPLVLVPAAVACIVVLMTYVVMPLLQRLFRPWLRSPS
ncbi:MAG: hypothetical protein AAGK22_09580 [Acidobacteriota bacterium]